MNKKEPIAIVGMACRFPGGANTPEEFWQLLVDRKDAITQLDDERWSREYYYHPDPSSPGKTYAKYAGQLDNVWQFEPEFFGLSPRETIQMDPQQRLLLELTWEALEEGGQVPARLRGSDCSVYIGISSTDYASSRFDDPALADSYFMTGNTLSIAANRISHIFDLRGQSVAIDTACSSFAVALHKACMSIWNGESPGCIAGTAHLLLSPFPFIGFSKASMLSPDGRCKVFDAKANGYVRSEGGAVFYLKPLSQAEADGDPIQAVILETGVNTDGGDLSLTVPDGDAQKALLESLYTGNGINAEMVHYIEAHGTGTQVGDPIEAYSIGNGLGMKRSRENPVLIGSVKSNIGHLEPASGAAGLMKVILSLRHRSVPASINFESLNPNIDFDALNLKLATEQVSLQDIPGQLVMGVNSFGFGGSNAHAVVAEYKNRQQIKNRPEVTEFPPLFLSAKSRESLQERAGQIAGLIADGSSQADIYDIFYTASLRRQRLRYGLVAYGGSLEKIKSGLVAYSQGQNAENIVTSELVSPVNKTALVFSGNGCQWTGMGAGLMEVEEFRQTVENIDNIFEPLAGWSIKRELSAGEAESRLEYTEAAQPLLFAVQLGILKLLETQGVRATAVMGHSVGEVAAAYAAGILDLEQAVRVIYYRSEAQGRTRGLGRMAAAQVSREKAEELIRQIGNGLELAAVNSPKSVTFTGPEETIAKLAETLEEEKTFCRVLDLDYAFHSRVMEEVMERFYDNIGELKPGRAELDYISTVTGKAEAGDKLNSEYWWHNLRDPVLFSDAVSSLIARDYGVFVEVGSHPILKTYVLECLRGGKQEGKCISTLKRNAKDEPGLLIRTVYETFLSSEQHNIGHFYKSDGHVVSLPVYPWNRETYRISNTSESTNRVIDHPLLGCHSNTVTGLWTNQLDLRTHPFLRDHMVGGVAVFPAAGFLEMALAASKFFFERDLHEISSFEIRRPLVIEEGHTRDIQLLLNTEDLNFTIKSRNRLSEQAWTVHAVGKLVSHATRGASYPFDFKQFKTDADNGFSREEVYRIADQVGLNYGEYFRGVDVIWVNKDTLVSTLDKKRNDSQYESRYVLGPGVLDAAFHTLFPAFLNGAEDISDIREPYLPIGVANINYYNTGKPVTCCVCEVLNHSGHSVTARFLLLDETNQVVARLDRCFFKQLTLSSHAGDEPAFYEFRQIPKNHLDLNKVSPLPSLDDLEKGILKHTANKRVLEEDIIFNEQILPLYDALASSLAERTLRELGAHIGEFTTESLLTTSGVNPEHGHFINHLLLMLMEDGKATYTGGRWKLDLETDDESIAIWRAIIADYPGCLPEIMATMKAGFKLVDLLTHHSLEEAAEKRESMQGNHFKFSRVVAEVIRSIIQYVVSDWPVTKRRLRIAEILDSDTSIARQLTAVLKKEFCDIHLLATNESIKVKAEQHFKPYPNVSISVLDLSGDGMGHQFVEGEFDILISLNWMHKCEDILKTFSQLSYLVASGGLLLFSEKQPSRLIDLNCGIDPEWWMRNSDENSPVSLLMQPDDWLVALDKTEFRDGRTLTDTISPNAQNFVIAAYREIRSKATEDVQIQKEYPWLLVCEDDGLSNTLAETLQFELATLGIQAVVGNVPKTANDEQYFQGLFAGIRNEHTSLEHIIYLNGLGLHSDMSNTNLVDGQSRCCMNVVNLLKSIETVYWDRYPTLWLITSDSFIQNNGTDKLRTPVLPNQSTLWGLGRVIRNEFPNIDCKMLDLQIGYNLQKMSHTLIEEISRTDEEDEIILSQDARKVIRLEESVPGYTLPQAADRHLSNTRRSSLTFSSPGHMDNLYWLRQEKPDIKSHEIEIEVVATGLNFRDIMFASGLLPDEMLENGYAGATLGLECSGIVTRAGDEVAEFNVGDEVIAFAPSSFSTHVITNTISVTHKPRHWSFEEAATVPTTFFTAYYSLGYLARLGEGEKVLIHGAAGGVGLAAIQYARQCGAEIFATAGTEEKRQFLKHLGVEHVLNSRTLDFADEIMDITGGEGIDVVLNSLAGEAIDKNFAVLKPFGRFLELGKRDFFENTRIGLRPFRNNIAYYGIDADQIISEQPELSRTLFKEIMDLFEQGDFRPLTHTVFPASDVASAFRLMQHSGHVGKIVVTIKDELGQVIDKEEKCPPIQISDNASYLITGGLSGFGLATARWLAARGARHIVLLGRRSADEAGVAAEIDEFAMSGVRMITRQCDISDPVALQKVLRDVEDSLPSLKGIIHAAMVLDDSSMRLLSEESMTRVMKPKIQGAWNLHQLTINLNLDFFILYSSVTTFVGNPGQANYVAANQYLEALARYRKARGLTALAIAWDAILDSGYLARNAELRDTLRKRLGVKGITTRQAFAAMEKALASGMTETAVLNANWQAMKRLLPTLSSPVYHYMVHAISEEDSFEDNVDIMEMIEGLTREEVHVIISGMLTDELAKILQLPAEKVEQNRSIQDLGVDSLMAMELVSAIESRFSIEIPIMAMSDNSTVDSIAARITRILTGDKNVDQGPDKDAVLIHNLAATHAESFSETELDEFAREFAEDKAQTKRMIQ